MALFRGRLRGPNLEPSTVTVQIADGRFRISSGRIKLGSWPLEGVRAKRLSIYRFSLDINGDFFEFTPEDPTSFSEEVGAVVDLTETRGKFGLKERIEQAARG
ncbi:MAG: hypothetical protein ACE5F5_08970 [Acidimicrobiia bacterium]